MNWTFASHGDLPPGEPDVGGGFAIDDHRMTWPFGSLNLSKRARTAGWGELWIAVVEPDALTIVAADCDYAVRLELLDLALIGTPTTREGALWIKNDHGVWTIPLAELEAIYEKPPAKIAIEVETTYPQRAPNARVVGKVAWLMADDALVNVGRAQLRLDRQQYGLEKGMEVAFVDALGPNRFVAIDVPGRPRQIVHEPLEPYAITATVEKRSMRRSIKQATAHLALTDDVAALLHTLAEHPEDDHSRAVLIDLLADRGEPCAVAFAQLRAGEKPTPNRVKQALGPLAKFWKPIAFDRGLPSTATLVKKPDEDPAAMLADMRLDMLREIRLGDGPAELYGEILAVRKLISLRVVDVSSFEIARILKAAEYDKLERVCNMQWTSELVVSLLASRLFAWVKHVEVAVYVENANMFVHWLLADRQSLWTPGRHLYIRETLGREPALARAVLEQLDAIPTNFTIGGVTLRRVEGAWRATIDNKSEHGVRGVLHDVRPELIRTRAD